MVHREDGVYDVPPAAMDSSLWLVGYYQDMVTQRRRTPSDDLTSALIEAEIDGDRLTEEEGDDVLASAAAAPTLTKPSVPPTRINRGRSAGWVPPNDDDLT